MNTILSPYDIRSATRRSSRPLDSRRSIAERLPEMSMPTMYCVPRSDAVTAFASDPHDAAAASKELARHGSQRRSRVIVRVPRQGVELVTRLVEGILERGKVRRLSEGLLGLERRQLQRRRLSERQDARGIHSAQAGVVGAKHRNDSPEPTSLPWPPVQR